MKMGWRMRRERMISGLHTYFLFVSFIFCVLQFYLNEMFCGLERCQSEFGGGGVT